jgi:DNA modification methylase
MTDKNAFPAYKTVLTANLIPYARNSRTHSDAQVTKIAASIKEFGFLNPIITDGSNSIVAGHGRVLAAQKLGLESLPVIEAAHLTDAQRKAYIIADNRLALDAGWDNDMLKVELQDLEADGFDLSLTGFDLGEIADFLDEPTEGLTDEDAVPDAPEVPVTVEGDVWLLGRHRLMCGDSTSIDAVEKLMDGQKADMIFTDPPYGVSYTGGLQDKGKGLKGESRQMIKNDDVDLYEDAVLIASQYCSGPVFMFYADTVPFGLYRGIENVGGSIVALIIWKKKGGYGALGASYKPNHEPCIIWKTKGSNLNFIGSTTENRIWEEDKDGQNKMHPTQKPVAIPERAIRNHKAATILDLFGGSGSTLIACEKTARDCRMMELDPKYCDVIIKRWQDFTGQTATLEATGQTYAEATNGTQTAA